MQADLCKSYHQAGLTGCIATMHHSWSAATLAWSKEAQLRRLAHVILGATDPGHVKAVETADMRKSSAMQLAMDSRMMSGRAWGDPFTNVGRMIADDSADKAGNMLHSLGKLGAY